MHTKVKCSDSFQSKIIAELDAAPDVKPRHWTEFEKETLRKYHQTKGRQMMAKALGKSLASVDSQAKNMGLTNEKI